MPSNSEKSTSTSQPSSSRHGSPTIQQQQSQTESQKLIEAKTAVILLKNSRLCTKNEYTQWLLKMLYQPSSRRDTEATNVLYLSRSRRKIWASDFAIHQDPSRTEAINRRRDQLYVITPKTSIMTLSQDNRLVYIIDLSSSLATAGNTRADILLNEVFQTLVNSLEGIVQPFSMQVSPTEKAVVQPHLRLTVMADCSQFASNVNVIPMLVEHPTMRVFMQNVVITANNIHTIIRKLRAEFLAFQEDTVQFRKFMKRNRSNKGYNLDVGNEVAPPGVLDATAATTSFSAVAAVAAKKKNKTFSAESMPISEDNKTSSSEVDLKAKDTSFYSSTAAATKKEVWGIGKSGANLSRILHAGHFALKLLPRQGRAQLILLTDGAMKSNVHDNTFVRQFAEEDITCHVIQIGYASSFIPGRNFGFVPDTEILQFLARATSGTFMYSDKCLTKSHANIVMYHDERASVSSAIPVTSSTSKSYPVVQFVDIHKAKHIQTPNIFHRQFMFRETILTRYQHSELILQAEKDSGTQLNRREANLMESSNERMMRERFNFPWDPYARPPEGEWRLLKYREYTLSSEFSHIIAARAREGFTLQSVTFDDGNGSKHVDSGIHDIEAPDFNAVRKERIQIVMILRWQPNVSIEYRIRATWLPSIIGTAPNSYKSEDILLSSGIFSRGKAPRAEIFVRTDASFAHMLQNWDMFRRRAQMMGVVTGSIYFGETYAAPVYSKIERLKTYLVDIFEGDEVLKTVIAFPCKFWTNVSNNTGGYNLESHPGSVASSYRSDTAANRGAGGAGSRLSIGQHNVAFVDAFKAFWERINTSDARARTRCWYDPGCIDLLVGDVSPYMTPKLSSSYNQEFVSNVEQDILAMVNHVKTVMQAWSDFEAQDGTFVKMMHKLLSSPTSNGANEDAQKDYFSAMQVYPPSFCELRVRHEYGRLITLRLLFFNVEVVTRKRAVQNLIHLIKTHPDTQLACNKVCERPFSRLLMRDPKHFEDSSSDATAAALNEEGESNVTRPTGNLTQNQSRAKAWYLPVAMWLTSEYIVRDYLKHMTWTWQTDNHQDAYHRENKMMPIHDLAFQFLCQARLDQGYQLVSPRPDSTQFYQEITLPSRDGTELVLCAIQYFVWKDSVNGKITTELWMEPSGNFDADQYELVKQWTFEPDRKTISQLVTFDQIHAVGRSKGVGDFKGKKRGNSHTTSDSPADDTTIMLLPQLFDVASVLRSNQFVVASFQSPQYKMALLPYSQHKQTQHQLKLKTMTPHYDTEHPHPQQQQQEWSDHSGSTTPVIRHTKAVGGAGQSKSHRYLRRHANVSVSVEAGYPTNSSASNSTAATPIIDGSQKLFSFRPDILLNKNKEVIAKLDVVLQNYALLHYFVEQSLDYIANGEILMSHHDVGATFWQDLRSALQSVTKDGKLSSTGLIPADLRKTRCFVKVFDPRSFVVILFPSLESISSGLLKLQQDDGHKSISTVERCRFLDVFMFECVRQKPMKPTKHGMSLEENNFKHIQNVLQDADQISIRPIEYLVHESDGLGVMLRPELFQGEYSCCQSQAQLTDRVLRVAQDVARFYSRSFLKSFYTCLMRGFMVDDDDLGKMLEVCNESTMEIDITEFVNTMCMQKHELIESDVQEYEIQEKFNAIFHQYFEPVQTKKGSISNLFYYKPPFNRSNQGDPRQEHMSEDDKISFIVDLVAHSRAPLLIRLNAAYKTTANQDTDSSSCTEIVVPVTSLPTSYTGHTVEGTAFDLEDTETIQNDTFPRKAGSTKVYLQIVCLNMSRSDLDDHSVTNNLFPYNPQFLIQSMQSQPDCFSCLTQDQQAALAETDARVNWLLKEETIHGLLKAPIITLSTLKYVENQLRTPCPFVEYQTSIKMPFQFVKNYQESRIIFMDELEKDSCCQKSGKYQLKRVGDYFYVCEDSVFNMSEESSYSNSASPVVTEPSPPSPTTHTDQEDSFASTQMAHDDFCDGLGISLSKFADREAEEEVMLNETAGVPLSKRPLYWLILIPYEKYVQIYFYSKLQMPAAGSDLLSPVKEKIKMIQERTNRLALLNSLQDTRICSKYLELPSEGSEANTIYSDDDDESTEEESEDMPDVFSHGLLPESDKFVPGQFSCPVVYTKRFPLHWRLQPSVALKFLTTDVLRLFTVINRPNMFVIERDGSIVYCKIYEESLSGTGIDADGSPNTVYGSPTHTLSGKKVEDDAQTLVAFSTDAATTATTPTPTSKRELSRISSTSPHPPRKSSAPRVSTNDRRELVLEVYGIDLPSWVEKEFVNLIENRLISQITLNEIQQFFVRNSTSKPTSADVDFILPTSKPPTHREMLRVPSLVNSPYTLLQYFRQSLLADNIRPLTGPYVRQTVSNYYDNIFFDQETDAVQDGAKRELRGKCETTREIAPGAFCFYYNCTKRLPGSSTPLELLVGQGMAGICLTLLDEFGVPISTVIEEGKCGGNFDPETIHQCLEEEFREAKAGSTYFHIWVDIWVTGSCDGDALMQHIYECYRQSLCDYFIEKTVTIDLGAALSMDGALQRAVFDKAEGRLGTVLRKKFIESVLFILRKASELKSPTVCSMDRAIQTTPWCMDDLVRYLDVELRKINPSLRPTVAWTSLGNAVYDEGDDLLNPNSKWELYRGFQYRQRQKIQSNIRLVAISGLDEFVEKLGSVSDSFGTERRPSAASDNDSQKARSRRSSGESANTEGSNNGQRRFSRGDTQDQSRASSALSNSGVSNRHSPQLDSKKHCFMIMTLDVHRLSIYTYNWSESVSQDLFNGIFRVANRQEARSDIMSNILHQKMGLFHHTAPIKDVIEKFGTSGQHYNPTRSLSTNLMSTAGTSYSASTPQIHLTSPKSSKKMGRQFDNASKAESASGTRTPGGIRRTNNNANTGNNSSSANANTGNSTHVVASMLDLKDMIAFPTTAPSRDKLLESTPTTVPPKSSGDGLGATSPNTRQMEQENYIDSILQKSIIRATELDHALMDSITDSVADTIRSKDFDILRRHGQPFLETFLRRAKIQSAHRKALKVYLKWRKRYGDPKTGVDLTERLSKHEVSTIMRSSRVLHFCRTPLIFCDPEREWPNLQEGSTGRADIVAWFKNMANALLFEYAGYLEGADMQLIDFAKDDNTQDNLNQSSLRSSKFSLGRRMTADCPPTFLLRVFEGGSIICEVRLTSVFVSVTLYTLHRQYGRLDYNRFRHETRLKKRANFKKFEENSGHFKQMIHINSFVYDFQLHYIQKMLDQPEKVPADLNILSFVRRFALTNQQPSPYSKDRIIHGFYQFDGGNVTSNAFFENLFKNAPRHGLLNVLASKRYSAVSISSFDLSFEAKTSPDPAHTNWKYTLVVCPAQEPTTEDEQQSSDKAKTIIEYFVLVVYQGQTTPESMTRASWLKKEPHSWQKPDLNGVSLPEEGYTLADIVSGARIKLDSIVSEVIIRSKRAHDWKKLYNANLTLEKSVKTPPDRPELVQLMSEFDRVDITEADKNIATIFGMKLDWDAALTTVQKVMKSSCKYFYEGGRRHLLLYNARYMDYMIHLRLDANKQIQGWMVSREKRTDRAVFEGAEIGQMVSLGKILYYQMWKVVASKNGV
ncbi:glycerophosphoinositol permease [Mucor velutinosus]|uniref:Glycerophosphoinositol permease n=1 Tax=Mucor velutinosus TaxID=708070 RepID=A0AAN7DSC2_9FUNG|nr:glycerophosphoinositol permease [Mucor velutinosus]